MLIAKIYRRHPKTVLPTATIQDVVKRMLKDSTNGYIVTDKHKHVLGVIALQDIAAAIVPREFRHNLGMAKAMYVQGFFHELCHDLKHQPVSSIMRKNFTSVDLNTNIMAVLTDFLENDLYIVPVINNKKLIGIVTRSEVKHALATGLGLTP